MRYLLDTNVLIYIIESDFSQLSNAQKAIIDNTDNELYVSEASYYELSIKIRANKTSYFKFDILKIEKIRKKFKLKLLKSKPSYYIGIIDVPKVNITENKLHGDPFDLLIISQAIKEKLPILSSDSLYPKYEGLKVIN